MTSSVRNCSFWFGFGFELAVYLCLRTQVRFGLRCPRRVGRGRVVALSGRHSALWRRPRQTPRPPLLRRPRRGRFWPNANPHSASPEVATTWPRLDCSQPPIRVEERSEGRDGCSARRNLAPGDVKGAEPGRPFGLVLPGLADGNTTAGSGPSLLSGLADGRIGAGRVLHLDSRVTFDATARPSVRP